MLGDSFWRERGFEPVPLGKGFKVFLALSVSAAVLATACGIAGTFAPFGLALIALAEHERRRGATWFGSMSFKREDHPTLFWFIVGQLYAFGVWVVVIDLYRLASAARAV